MNQLKFDGEDLILEDKQFEFIIGVLEKHGFQNGTVTVESVGKVNDNYGSSVKRFTVKEDDRILKMIAKIAPSDPRVRVSLQSKVTFQNETVMYLKVLPKFAELERRINIPEGDRLRFAECFGVLPEEPHEIILLEDLNESNFCIFDKFKSLNDDTARLVLESFAKFHSLSFVFKHANLDVYKSFAKDLTNPWHYANIKEGMNAFFCCLEEETLNFVDNEEHKKIIKGSLSNMTNNFENIMNNNDGSSVIQQGDAWTNNIMFTMKNSPINFHKLRKLVTLILLHDLRFLDSKNSLFEKQNNKAVECCMIDYQNSNESNPAADILYMIFNCTDYQTRSAYYLSWIDHYYGNLILRLRTFGLNSDEVYPRGTLDEDLKRMGKIAIGQAIMAASILVRETHEAAEIKEAMKDDNTDNSTVKYKLEHLGESSLKRFKEKLKGLLKSYEEIGFYY